MCRAFVVCIQLGRTLMFFLSKLFGDFIQSCSKSLAFFNRQEIKVDGYGGSFFFMLDTLFGIAVSVSVVT